MSVNSRQQLAICAPVVLSLFGLALAQNGPETALAPDKRFSKRVVTSGLAGPWEVAWGPDNMLWITERTARRIVRVNPATGERKVAITLPDVSAPGGQDGLLGMALHPDLLTGKGADYVYVAYTTVDRSKAPNPHVSDPSSPYRYLYMRVVRLTYNPKTQLLSNPTPLLTGLPAGDDHDGGRLKFGPDRKLYLTIGDQGHNQFGNFCLPIESQRLPTQAEVAAGDYSAYVGKSLRINLDGSIPGDNPRLKDVVSHVFTYGHRNPQGLSFSPRRHALLLRTRPQERRRGQHPQSRRQLRLAPRGRLPGRQILRLRPLGRIQHALAANSNTATSRSPPPSPANPNPLSSEPFHEPLATLFTAPTGFNFQNPACKGFEWICWPTVGIGSLEYYESGTAGIPGWDRALLVTALKRGSLYVIPLKPDGQSGDGRIYRYFRSENRYRDVAVGPDRKTIYIATDPAGGAESLSGGLASQMQDRGAILAFTYLGEGAEQPPAISQAPQAPAPRPLPKPPPAFRLSSPRSRQPQAAKPTSPAAPPATAPPSPTAPTAPPSPATTSTRNGPAAPFAPSTTSPVPCPPPPRRLSAAVSTPTSSPSSSNPTAPNPEKQSYTPAGEFLDRMTIP